MFRSMTGFASRDFVTKKGKFVIELQSVNRRFLECSIFLPKEFFHLETEIRKMISQKISRGNMTLRLLYIPKIESIEAMLPMLQDLKKIYRHLEKKLSLSSSIDLSFLLQQLKAFPKLEEKEYFEEEKKAIFQQLQKALKELLLMKEKEGKELLKDIRQRMKKIINFLEKIKKIAPRMTEKFEKKLQEKCHQYLEEKDDRLLKEIAIFAEKVDITEEMVRFQSHIEQLRSLFQEKNVGRKIDFLLQEMFREINTIASKALDATISSYAVCIKSELEKMKEQIQNVE